MSPSLGRPPLHPCFARTDCKYLYRLSKAPGFRRVYQSEFRSAGARLGSRLYLQLITTLSLFVNSDRFIIYQIKIVHFGLPNSCQIIASYLDATVRANSMHRARQLGKPKCPGFSESHMSGRCTPSACLLRIDRATVAWAPNPDQSPE